MSVRVREPGRAIIIRSAAGARSGSNVLRDGQPVRLAVCDTPLEALEKRCLTEKLTQRFHSQY